MIVSCWFRRRPRHGVSVFNISPLSTAPVLLRRCTTEEAQSEKRKSDSCLVSEATPRLECLQHEPAQPPTLRRRCTKEEARSVKMQRSICETLGPTEINSLGPLFILVAPTRHFRPRAVEKKISKAVFSNSGTFFCRPFVGIRPPNFQVKLNLSGRM